MKLKVFAIRDNVSDTFEAPQCGQSSETVMRGLRYMLKAVPDFALKRQNPKDFDLYLIGEFDVTNGVLIPCDKTLVCNFTDLVKE